MLCANWMETAGLNFCVWVYVHEQRISRMKNAKPVGSYDKHICLKNELLVSCTYKSDCAKKDTEFSFILSSVVCWVYCMYNAFVIWNEQFVKVKKSNGI